MLVFFDFHRYIITLWHNVLNWRLEFPPVISPWTGLLFNKLTLELTILGVFTDFVFFSCINSLKFIKTVFRNRLLATRSLNFKPDVINMLIIIPLKDGITFLLCNNWDNVTRNPREELNHTENSYIVLLPKIVLFHWKYL